MKRSRQQFSLRQLLFAITLIAIACGAIRFSAHWSEWMNRPIEGRAPTTFEMKTSDIINWIAERF
jgi:hypothetical protein